MIRDLQPLVRLADLEDLRESQTGRRQGLGREHTRDAKGSSSQPAVRGCHQPVLGSKFRGSAGAALVIDGAKRRAVPRYCPLSGGRRVCHVSFVLGVRVATGYPIGGRLLGSVDVPCTDEQQDEKKNATSSHGSVR